jgi:hypothetical protein
MSLCRQCEMTQQQMELHESTNWAMMESGWFCKGLPNTLKTSLIKGSVGVSKGIYNTKLCTMEGDEPVGVSTEKRLRKPTASHRKVVRGLPTKCNIYSWNQGSVTWVLWPFSLMVSGWVSMFQGSPYKSILYTRSLGPVRMTNIYTVSSSHRHGMWISIIADHYKCHAKMCKVLQRQTKAISPQSPPSTLPLRLINFLLELLPKR